MQNILTKINIETIIFIFIIFFVFKIFFTIMKKNMSVPAKGLCIVILVAGAIIYWSYAGEEIIKTFNKIKGFSNSSLPNTQNLDILNNYDFDALGGVF